MKRILSIALIWLLSACTSGPKPLPAELVGIWANDGAILREDKWLVSGQALYLAADGSGAILAGPPPIGMAVRARFDAGNNMLTIHVMEQEQLLQTMQIPYTPGNPTLDVGTVEMPMRMRKRSDVVDVSIKRGLGL